MCYIRGVCHQLSTVPVLKENPGSHKFKDDCALETVVTQLFKGNTGHILASTGNRNRISARAGMEIMRKSNKAAT
jgi:hypothetical protein